MTAPNRPHLLKPPLDAQDAVFEPLADLELHREQHRRAFALEPAESAAQRALWSELSVGLAEATAYGTADALWAQHAERWRTCQVHARRWLAIDDDQEAHCRRGCAFAESAAAALRPLSAAIEALRAWAAEQLGLRARRGAEVG